MVMEKLKSILERYLGNVFPGATFSIITPNNITLNYVGNTDIDKIYDLFNEIYKLYS